MEFKNPKDIKKREELLKLFDDWKAIIKTKNQIFFPNEGKYFDALDYFNTDGFFPGYFSTKPRILFIGRESRNCSKCDRINYKNPYEMIDELGGGYWNRMLRLVYGIKKGGNCQFTDIPAPIDILKKMIKYNNYGFAIMNISKYSNDGKWPANCQLINQFLKDSELEKRNFIREEIELLEPNIIITLNLWETKIKKEYLNLIFGTSDFQTDDSENAEIGQFNLKGKTIKLVNTYHFSAYTIKHETADDQKHFYDPVMKLLFN